MNVRVNGDVLASLDVAFQSGGKWDICRVVGLEDRGRVYNEGTSFIFVQIVVRNPVSGEPGEGGFVVCMKMRFLKADYVMPTCKVFNKRRDLVSTLEIGCTRGIMGEAVNVEC